MADRDWESVLETIKSGKEAIPVTRAKDPAAQFELPTIALSLELYELLQLLEATTAGYNYLLRENKQKDRKIRRLKTLAEAGFKAKIQNNR